MHTKSLRELSSDLHAKKISSVELTQHYLDRINKFDKDLNSFITVTPEHALNLAKKADELIKQNKAGVLTGIPMAQKDIFCTQDIKTTCGSKMLDNFIAPYNATVVEKCNQAGLVMLGKTNMDEFAMGASNETSFYGPVKNPWDLSCVPGGSSGGSAAAIAAGLTPIATGTDTGGSIRQPAAMCNLTGLKPTYGCVSRYGMIAFASSLDQGGPMGRSAEDVALFLNVLAGFDEKDSTSVEREKEDYTKNLNNPINKLKIGLPKEYFTADLNKDIHAALDEAIKIYKKLGAEFIEISLPNSPLAIPVYYTVAPAECSSNLSRFDGVRYGHRCKNPKDLLDLYKRSRDEGFGAEVKRRILTGTYVLSAGYYDAYYLKAQRIRHLIRDDFTKAFEKVDIILGATAPTTAFPIGSKINDPVSMYLADIYTSAVNLAGLPGMSIPVGFQHKLPIGMQLIGPHFSEAKLLNTAHVFQQATDFHTKTPGGF
ncbi:MAG TPA: Asp-tRNA(Asn)/Glu-tRNA(Gln) amidotransferase subunit GatA [Gammaproteobacteria bacterium]|nr:Asp-tRNA(Asn)/Glu-tRNA(Gln) amidotransferase subunit GatA [Gammaproteobacteria bacterium]